MRTTLSLIAIAGLATVASADIITQWNFNGVPPDASTSTGSTAPSTGAGTASAVGGTTASFASGASNGGSSDPTVTDDTGWGLTTFPAAAVGNETAGAQFLVSTVGYQNITISYDLRHSNTSSRYEQVQYTIDGGTTWTNIGAAFDGNAGDTWFNGRSVDLASITGVNENALFGIRVVSTFNGGSAYAASATTYATSGTWRFDMVTINGTAVPTPGAAALLALGGLAAGRRKR